MSSTTRKKSFIPKSVKKNVPTTQRGASNRKDAHGELKPSKNKPNAGNKVSKTTHGATSNTVEEKKKGTANEGSKSDSVSCFFNPDEKKCVYNFDRFVSLHVCICRLANA